LIDRPDRQRTGRSRDAKADSVIDLMGMGRGTEQQQTLDAGTRILLVKEPPRDLHAPPAHARGQAAHAGKHRD